MVFKPDGLGRQPYSKLNIRQIKMRSISKPSYLDMPMVKSISSVYQTKILKDAMQFHHADFNNCAKSTL